MTAVRTIAPMPAYQHYEKPAIQGSCMKTKGGAWIGPSPWENYEGMFSRLRHFCIICCGFDSHTNWNCHSVMMASPWHPRNTTLSELRLSWAAHTTHQCNPEGRWKQAPLCFSEWAVFLPGISWTTHFCCGLYPALHRPWASCMDAVSSWSPSPRLNVS